MLTLYQFDSCPFCWKVKALLNFVKQDYRIVEVSPFGMKELDFTEHKKVPVLRDGEKIITESSAIVKYVNDTYVHLPSNTDSEQWVKWLDDKLVHYITPIVHPSRRDSFRHLGQILPSDKFKGIKRFFVRLMGSLALPMIAKKIQKKHNIKSPKEEFLIEIDHWIDQGLNNNPFFGGDSPDFVDCSVFGVLHSVHKTDVLKLASQHNPSFGKWYNACVPLMTKQ